jgi:hypothetical protein
MARDNYRKVKLLKLIELLRQHTDEQHPMTTNEVCAAMDAMGIPCDRRTLAQDVAALNDLGYEIMDTIVGHQKAYYVEDRSFSPVQTRFHLVPVRYHLVLTRLKMVPVR